jgi:hypothetical protein
VTPIHQPKRQAAKAGNWVDRGESPATKVSQIIAYFLGEPDAATQPEPWLTDAVSDMVGMVSANASEVELAKYLRSLAVLRGTVDSDAAPKRATAIAIWHVIKAAEVRDRANRVIEKLTEGRAHAVPALADWLAERILSPEELARHRAERDPEPPLPE